MSFLSYRTFTFMQCPVDLSSTIPRCLTPPRQAYFDSLADSQKRIFDKMMASPAAAAAKSNSANAPPTARPNQYQSVDAAAPSEPTGHGGAGGPPTVKAES